MKGAGPGCGNRPVPMHRDMSDLSQSSPGAQDSYLHDEPCSSALDDLECLMRLVQADIDPGFAE